MQKPKLISVEKGRTIYSVDGYVEFMNWLCAAFYNLRGDAEGNSAGGHIEIKWVDDTHPVIALSGGLLDDLKEGSGIKIEKDTPETGKYTISAHYV